MPTQAAAANKFPHLLAKFFSLSNRMMWVQSSSIPRHHLEASSVVVSNWVFSSLSSVYDGLDYDEHFRHFPPQGLRGLWMESLGAGVIWRDLIYYEVAMWLPFTAAIIIHEHMLLPLTSCFPGGGIGRSGLSKENAKKSQFGIDLMPIKWDLTWPRSRPIVVDARPRDYARCVHFFETPTEERPALGYKGVCVMKCRL